MATIRPTTVPTTAPLSGSLLIPSTHPAVLKSLLRLSRPSLLSLVQEWLRTSNQATCGPVLGEADDAEDPTDLPYESVRTLDELREIYAELAARRGGKREVVDRISEGDWRRGLSLRQLAMLDVQHLLDHPASQRWTARRIAHVSQASEKEAAMLSSQDTSILDAASAAAAASESQGDTHKLRLPRFHGGAFVANLQAQLGPMLKAHYYLTHLRILPVVLLRISIQESPYNSQSSLEGNRPGGNRGDASAFKTVYLAFPDHSNFVYIATTAQPGPSIGSATDIRKLVIDATSRALSSRGHRFALRSTSLSARSLHALVALRGPDGTVAAAGAWNMFAEGTVDPSPLAPVTGVTARNTEEDNGAPRAETFSGSKPIGPRKRPPAGDADEPHRKRRRQIAEKRFGTSAQPDDKLGIDRVDLRLENRFAATAKRREALGARDANAVTGKPRQGDKAAEGDDDEWRPRVEITLHGSHVFAGIRALVESGAVDGVAMPGWMTGENGVSTGVVRNGLIRGQKGSGY